MSFWCDDLIRVRIAGPAGERDVTFEQPWALIGHGSRSSLVLEGPGVRKRALLLVATNIGLYAMNLDRPEAPPDERGRWITSDEPLIVGPFRLQASLGSGKVAAEGLPDLVTGRSPLPIPVLHVFGDGLLKDRRRLRHPLCLVGRRPQCSLQLRGEKVSSYHAGFYWQDHRLWCFDLLSANGTLLGGAPLASCEVQLNERLEVGEFELLYYRWSPRHATPGMERLAANEAGAVWESNAAETVAVETVTSPIAPVLPTGGSAAGSQQSAAETPQSAQFASQLDERLMAERRTFLAAQNQWQAERERMQAELIRLKAEIEVVAKADARGVEFEAREAVSATRLDASQTPGEVERGVAGLEPFESSTVELAHERPTHDGLAPDGIAASEAIQEVVPPVDSAGSAEPINDTASIAFKPAPRRKAQPRAELTSFVSGRLSDLEHNQRRRMYILWTAAVASTLAIAATAFGLWAWLL